MAESQNQPPPLEYAEAFRSIRCAKNLFWFLLGLSILIQLISFIAIDFFGVIDGSAQIAAVATTTAPSEGGIGDADVWYYSLQWILPGTKFIAVVSAGLLALTLMLGVKISLLGRLGGVAGLISAMFWSLILLAIVVPWQQIVHGQIASGALYNLGDLVAKAKTVKASWGAEDTSLAELAFYYGRFMALPIIALLVWLVTQAKFARGCRGVQLPATVETE